MPSKASAASVIVPTFKEAENIGPLSQRLFAAMSEAGIEAELIIVDDNSQDGTEELVRALSESYPVCLVTRRNERGLSSAVLAGFREARFDRFVVLDADLQHPPELVPKLLLRLGEKGCDFVVASRYTQGGVIDRQWSSGRRFVSRVATMLARPLVPLSDPMSGFFALHRQTWERSAKLDPIGYKIGLELFVKGRCRQPAEVPISFAPRAAGKSKLGWGVIVRYLHHLTKLYRFKFPIASHVVWIGSVLLVIVLGWLLIRGR